MVCVMWPTMSFSNPYFLIILLTMVLAWLLETISSILNVRALQPQPPADLADIYEPEKYAKSQAHIREGTRADLFADFVKLAVLLAFWLLGGFGWWEQLARSFGLGSLATGLVFIGGLAVASSLLSLPFEIYDTFVLEAKYGFNKTTVATFVGDRIKGMVLGTLIGGGILAAVLWIFEKMPNAWLYAWGAVTAFTLAMTYAGPKWIMPLFNKFTPLEDGELKRSIAAMAQRCVFPFAEICDGWLQTFGSGECVFRGHRQNEDYCSF